MSTNVKIPLLENNLGARISHFKMLLENYATAVREAGVAVSSFSDPQVPHFTSLSEADQLGVIESLRLELEIFSEIKSEGGSLRDSPRFVWRCLQKLGLRPKSDIFDKMGSEDVVSIYLSNHKQTFQNLRFLELVSLTLEQIYCKPWYTYSKRDEQIEKELYELSSKVFSGEILETISPSTPEHEAWEVDTEGLARLMIKVKYMSPVMHEHTVVGMIVINHCTPLGGKMNGTLPATTG